MLTTVDPMTFPCSVVGAGFGISIDGTSAFIPAFANTGEATVPSIPLGLMAGITGHQLSNDTTSSDNHLQQCTPETLAAANRTSSMNMLMYRMFGASGYTG